MKARLEAGKPIRVVSTQVIEAGVDASFPDLWRARGPLESIVQAAGRCNRNDEMKPEKGRVRVFDMIEGRMPPGEYETRTEAASKWLDGDLSEIATPEVQTAYFRRLLTAGTGSLGTDRHREKRWLQEQRAKLDYPFTERHGKMIEDEGIAVVVASWRPKATGPLLESARFDPRAVRKLAPYTVSLRNSLIQKPDVKHFFHDHESGVKVYDGPYDAQLGVGGDGTLDPEGLIGLTCAEADAEFVLRQIRARSEGTTMEAFRREWRFDSIHLEVAPEYCVCGGYPTERVVYLVNPTTGYELVVGETCAERFFLLRLRPIFQAVEAICGDVDSAPASALVRHAEQSRWITPRASAFLRGTERMKRLRAPKAQAWRRELNVAILARCVDTLSVRRINGR